MLLEHFKEVVTISNCNNCDNCKARATNRKDLSAEVYQLLQAIKQTGERFGMSVPIVVLRGSLRDIVVKNKLQMLPVFNKGTAHSEEW